MDDKLNSALYLNCGRVLALFQKISYKIFVIFKSYNDTVIINCLRYIKKALYLA